MKKLLFALFVFGVFLFGCIAPAPAAPTPTPSLTCGGIMGQACPSGYLCRYGDALSTEPEFPDQQGTCQEMIAQPTLAPTVTPSFVVQWDCASTYTTCTMRQEPCSALEGFEYSCERQCFSSHDYADTYWLSCISSEQVGTMEQIHGRGMVCPKNWGCELQLDETRKCTEVCKT